MRSYRKPAHRFNASQDQYEAVCVGQDSYDAAVQNTIAAFRAGQHPTLVQSFDAGTADLMMSGEFYPVQTMMKDFGIEIDWANYFPGIANYYASSTGELFSMPFNSSTAMYYYNTDQLAKAGITHRARHMGADGRGVRRAEGVGFDLPDGLCTFDLDRPRAVLDGSQRAGRDQ